MKFGTEAQTIIRATLESGGTPALMGDPGIGKSSFVTDLARRMNTKAFVLPCNQLAEKADLTGSRLMPDKEHGYIQMFFPHWVITEAVGYARENPRETPILFLDEINRAPSDVTSGILTLVTLRKMGGTELPDNLRIIVAGNDRGNVTTLDEASLSRFVIFRMTPDASTLLGLLGDTLDQWTRKVLTEHPELVLVRTDLNAVMADDPNNGSGQPQASIEDFFDAEDSMNQMTTPRTIENLGCYLRSVPLEDLADYAVTAARIGDREVTLLNEVVEAFVGNTRFAELVVDEIVATVSNPGNAQQSQLTVPRPSSWDDLARATSMSQLNELVQQMSDHERSGCLLYALYDREGHQAKLRALAPALGEIDPDHMQLLVAMLSKGNFDRDNVRALKETSGPAVDKLRAVLSAYV